MCTMFTRLNIFLTVFAGRTALNIGTTQVKHPWTNGQGEQMNRSLKEVTVKTFTYATTQQLKGHLHDFLMAYNFAKRLKTLRGKTPWQFIQQEWKNKPQNFTIEPSLGHRATKHLTSHISKQNVIIPIGFSHGTVNKMIFVW